MPKTRSKKEIKREVNNKKKQNHRNRRKKKELNQERQTEIRKGTSKLSINQPTNQTNAQRNEQLTSNIETHKQQ